MNHFCPRERAVIALTFAAFLSLIASPASALSPPLNPVIFPLDADLSYSCTFPVVEEQTIRVALTSEAPSQVKGSEPFEIGINAEIEFSTEFTDVLRTTGVSGITGVVDADISLHVHEDVSALPVPLTLHSNTLPSGETPLSVAASGTSDTLRIEAYEVYLAAADTMRLTLAGRQADGSTSSAPFDNFVVDCTLNEPNDETLTIRPSPIDFHKIVSGTDRRERVVIKNDTSYTAYVSEITIQGDDPDAFLLNSWDVRYCDTLAPLQACVVDVTYVASTPGADSASLHVVSNLGNDQAPLLGTSVIDAVPEFAVTPKTLDFGKVEPGERVGRKVTVTNLGPGLMSFIIPYLPDGDRGFSAPGPSCSSLDVGESCSKTVVFAPQDYEDTISRGILAIEAVHPESNPVNVSLIADARPPEPCTQTVHLVDLAGEATLGAAHAVTELKGDLEGETTCMDPAFMGSLQLESTNVQVPYVTWLFPDSRASVHLEFEPIEPHIGYASDAGLLIEAQYYVEVPRITVNLFGYQWDIGGGGQCQTAEPATLNLDGDFLQAGVVTGTFEIGPFENCGSVTKLLNRHIIGPGSPVRLEGTGT